MAVVARHERCARFAGAVVRAVAAPTGGCGVSERARVRRCAVGLEVSEWDRLRWAVDRGLAAARRGRRVSERDTPAEVKHLMDVDALTLPHMAHGEADCTVKVLNVREGPSLQAKIIGSLTAGQRVTVWAAGKPWWLVQAADGLTGWAYGEYLKPVKELVRAASLTVALTVEGDMTFPVVLDLNGTIRDWAWLRAKYGNVSYLEAAGYPKFQLSKVEEMEGPQTHDGQSAGRERRTAQRAAGRAFLAFAGCSRRRICRSFRRDRSLATPPAA